jgi:predicted phage terminase large subunit-like protein
MRFSLVEDKANGPAVVSTLKNKITGLITYTPKESKEARASAASPQYEAGNIWLPDRYYPPNRERYGWIGKLLDIYIDEHKNFPYAQNDDCVDMTTQVLLRVGGQPDWLQTWIEKDEKKIETADRVIQEKNQAIAEKMGWDIDLDTGGNGLPFDLDF